MLDKYEWVHCNIHHKMAWSTSLINIMYCYRYSQSKKPCLLGCLLDLNRICTICICNKGLHIQIVQIRAKINKLLFSSDESTLVTTLLSTWKHGMCRWFRDSLLLMVAWNFCLSYASAQILQICQKHLSSSSVIILLFPCCSTAVSVCTVHCVAFYPFDPPVTNGLVWFYGV